MSGGSYNYLFAASPSLLVEQHEDNLRRMADRLAALGYAEDAARETEETILIIRQMEVRLQARINRLADVWHAVEWWDSGDRGEDGLRAALEAYRSGTP